MTLVLAESLAAHQTYTLFLGTGARDAHGNAMARGQRGGVHDRRRAFRPARSRAAIEARGFPAPGTYLWCYDAATGHVPDSTARDFDAVGLADENGNFRVPASRFPAATGCGRSPISTATARSSPTPTCWRRSTPFSR